MKKNDRVTINFRCTIAQRFASPPLYPPAFPPSFHLSVLEGGIWASPWSAPPGTCGAVIVVADPSSIINHCADRVGHGTGTAQHVSALH